MALALGEGHSDVLNYGWNFFMTVMEVIADKRQNGIINMAIAMRASSMEGKDFNEFIGVKPMSHDEIYKKHKADEL